MQISKAMADLLNAQVGNELGASNQYLQIASYFDGESHFPNWPSSSTIRLRKSVNML